MVEEYINREAPDIEARKLGLIDSAKALTEKGYVLPDYVLAGLTPEQQQAFKLAQSGIGAYQPYLDAAKDYTEQGQNILQGTVGAPTQAQLDSYMNPFQQQVIDATMSELDKRGQMQANQLAGDAVRGGVFGGSRYGVQQAELSGQQQDARAAALANLNAQNFGQAQAGVANQMERQRLAGLGIAGLGQQQSQLAGQAQALLGQDVNALLGIGGMQQQYAQQQEDIRRQNLMQPMLQPYQQLGFYSDILQGAPTSSQMINTAQGASVSPMQQAIGTGIGAMTGLAGLRKLGVV
jgi:hypothetical protein